MTAILMLAALAVQADPDKGKVPEFDAPVMFNTPQADKVLAAMQIFPADNPWNEDVSKRPVAPNSRQMIAAIGADKRLACNRDMSFILVPPNQKRVPVKLTAYPDESDKGPFPVPDNAPIE